MGDGGGEPPGFTFEQKTEGSDKHSPYCHAIETTNRGRMAKSIYAIVLYDTCLYLGWRYTRGGELAYFFMLGIAETDT